MELMNHFITLFLDAAPWLLVGLVIAGLLKVFVPMSWMHKQLGGHGPKTVIKAALLGAPLPLCSCGVIPAAVGLRRAGASKAATTSFMVSTPETGVDSIALSYVLLGPFMAIIRPIAAIISAIVAGLLVGREDKNPIGQNNGSCSGTHVHASASKKACEQKNDPSCCPGDHQHDIEKDLAHTSVWHRTKIGLKYAANDLIEDTSLWLLVGLFFAALVQAYVPSDFLSHWGHSILAMLVMVVISIPMYICATASTPIAAGLLLAGVSPGAVLVFMLAGPATNIATLGVVGKELGKRALAAYLGGVLSVALLAGMATNYLVSYFSLTITAQQASHQQILPLWLEISAAMILAVLMAKALCKSLHAFQLKLRVQH